MEEDSGIEVPFEVMFDNLSREYLEQIRILSEKNASLRSSNAILMHQVSLYRMKEENTDKIETLKEKKTRAKALSEND